MIDTVHLKMPNCYW